MPAALAIALSILVGSHVGAALTVAQIITLAGEAAQALPVAVQEQKQIDAYVHSPQFRKWVAANGEAAIRLQPGVQDRYPR